jgi:hypothetical protein
MVSKSQPQRGDTLFFIRVAFRPGTSLRRLPSGESQSKDTRYLNIHQDDEFDEAQLAAW